MLPELRPGDIILVRGTRFRSHVSRFLSFLKWNHAVLYYGGNRVRELGWGGTKNLSFSTYARKQIVVLRLLPVDALIQTSRDMAFTSAMNKLKNIEFDWKAFLVRIILHSPKFNTRGRATCEAYVELVYSRAQKGFAPHDFKTDLNIYDLMRHDYSETELRSRYKLTKVYDYRDK